MAFSCTKFSILILLSISAALVQSENEEPRVAIAVLLPSIDIIPRIDVIGTISFTEQANATIRVFGSLKGLPPGRYGFHIHELGNTITCTETGAHFRDFGDVTLESEPGAPGHTVNFEDSHIQFSGENNILGRSIVLHELEDDQEGNAGRRIACGVIGIYAGVWHSAGVTIYSSTLLVAFGIAFLFFK